MTYKDDYYQVPTGIDKETAELIIKKAPFIGSEKQLSTVGSGDEGTLDKKARHSHHRWLPTDCWVAGMMAHLIHEANHNFYAFDLHAWSDYIQFTEYNGKGKHYGWHTDTAVSTLLSGGVRKLSISLLLSDPSDYEGGEFQLMFPGNKEILTIKPEIGQAIIFPSYCSHRVRPLKSGKRISLVGWFGGVPFK